MLRLETYSQTTLGLVLFLSSAMWGLYWLPLRYMENAGIEGTWSIAYFNACPLLVLYPLLLVRRRGWSVGLGPALLAGCLVGLAVTSYATGLVASSVVRATLLFYLTPIWSTIVGALWLGDHLTLGRVAAILVGLLGVFLLIFQANSSELPLNIGDLFAAMSGVFWAFGAATLKRWPEAPTLTVTTIQVTTTALSAAILSVVLFEIPYPQLTPIRSVFALAFAASVLILLPTMWLLFRIAQILFPGRVGVLMMSEVLVAVVSASILLPEEQLSPVQWLGAMAIVAAALLEVLTGSRGPQGVAGPGTTTGG